jgi:hypothetical protein
MAPMELVIKFIAFINSIQIRTFKTLLDLWTFDIRFYFLKEFLYVVLKLACCVKYVCSFIGFDCTYVSYGMDK